MLKTLEERVATAVSRMTIKEPLLATVFTRLERRFHDEEKITAYTDGRRVGFGREYCGRLPDDELLFVVIHEAMHVALMHSFRTGSRDRALANIAQDAVINCQLKAMGYWRGFEKYGWVMLPWVTTEMGWEEVYARLLQENGGKGGGKGQGDLSLGQTGGGGFNGEGDVAPAPEGASEMDAKASIQAAARMAKACGCGNGVVSMVLEGALDSVVPWQDALRHLMLSKVRDDYSYRRWSRRHFATFGVVCPTLYSDSMGGMVLGFDTSGSIFGSPEELHQIAAEINAIAEDLKPEYIEVVYCDSDVAGVERFEQGDKVILHPKGGGGTRFKPVFDYVEKMETTPAVLVYFTDLEGNYEECQPLDCDMVWAVTCARNQRVKTPVGTVLAVEA